MQGDQPKPEDDAEQRGGGDPGGRHPGDAQLAVPERQQSGEDQPEDDDHGADHPGDDRLVGVQRLAGGAGHHPGGDEHRCETQDEEQGAGQHATAPTAGDDLGRAQPGGVGEVAGQQGHHAGREERDQSGQQRDRQGQGHRSADCRGGPAAEVEARDHDRFAMTQRPAATSLISATRLILLIVPATRAAIRFCWSITSVVGMALGGRSAGQGDQHLALRIEDLRVTHVERADEGQRRGGAVVLGVQAEELRGAGRFPAGGLEVLGFEPAGCAPRTPDVEDDHLTGIVRRADRAIRAESRALDHRGRLAVRRRHQGDGAVAADEAWLVARRAGSVAGAACQQDRGPQHRQPPAEARHRGCPLRPGSATGPPRVRSS